MSQKGQLSRKMLLAFLRCAQRRARAGSSTVASRPRNTLFVRDMVTFWLMCRVPRGCGRGCRCLARRGHEPPPFPLIAGRHAGHPHPPWHRHCNPSPRSHLEATHVRCHLLMLRKQINMFCHPCLEHMLRMFLLLFLLLWLVVGGGCSMFSLDPDKLQLVEKGWYEQCLT